MIISIEDVIAFKKAVDESLRDKIHFHDGCGGQYFSFDEPNEELKRFAADYFAIRQMKAVFSEDGTRFYLDEVR